DREERPDLDHVYQAAHVMLTGRHGGWPLTLFLMPDETPFFGGTYFPKEPAYGLPGFKELLPRIAAAYFESRQAIEEHGKALKEALGNTVQKPSDARDELSLEPMHAAFSSLEKMFDPDFGGFGHAPKFPNPTMLDLCLRHPSHERLALFTLEKMKEGGIHDQLGGGFCRYSVDDIWNIPHFEKMLYDNGQLLRLYADAWAITKNPVFRDAAYGIATWATREMQSPEGGYHSSLDADSEHVEGKYYRWSAGEIASLLTEEEFQAARLRFGLDRPPNFEHFHHLYEARSVEAVSKEIGKDCSAVLESAKKKLFDAREKRARPGRDEKILTSWNALMLSGMAHAARVFGEKSFLRSARRAASFIREKLWQDGRLFATFKDGNAKLNAYLDDYAFLLDAQIELLQAQFEAGDLEFAKAIADSLLSRFEDKNEGGFYFTSHDHESLLFRQKPAEDGAIPSGNGIAAVSLQRLGHVLGEPRYIDAAKGALKLFLPAIGTAACCSLVKASEEALVPPSIIALTGPDAEKWHASLSERHLPGSIVLVVPSDMTRLPQTLQKPHEKRTAAWVCRGFECLPPVHDLDELLSAL
ncbi:MAG TPA: thioredoxin domain-containing protein, partial [Burkholderiales bacterium]|nr:thioredoxin domain-containing protein [Burkholderiales bacterium]